MIKQKVYTGGGVTFTTEYAEGRKECGYVCLKADEGKTLTNGNAFIDCVYVKAEYETDWTEVDAVEDDELTSEEALSILTGEAE